MPICRPPTQARSPRTKRFFSGSRLIASTAPIDKTEITTVSRHRNVRSAREQPVKNAVGEYFKPRFLAISAGAVDDGEALPPFSDHFGYELNRILQVCVDYRHEIACRLPKASGDRRLVTEISRKENDADASIGFGDTREQHRSSIIAAVIYIDDLQIELAAAAEDIDNLAWVSGITCPAR